MAFTTNQAIVANYYIASLGRAPDTAGLAYWTAQLDNGTMTNNQVRDFFMDTTIPEVAVRFPTGQTTEATVASVYNSVLGRTADAAGQAYWVSRLDGTNTDGQPKVNSLGELLDAMVGAATAPNDAGSLANKQAAAEYYIDNAVDGMTPPSTDSINDNAATLTAVKNTVNDDAIAHGSVPGVVGNTYMLTKGLDNLTGTADNDTFVGSMDATNVELNTMSSIDRIDGGAGIDTLEISTTAALTTANLPALTSVEIISINATNTVAVDTSAIAGVTNLNVTRATNTLALEAADTTNISVKGATNTIDIDGGKNIVVNDATADQAITIGATTAATGKITVTDTKQGTAAIAIDGGTDVTVNTTISADLIAVNGGDLTIGAATPATGNVSVTQNLNATGGNNDADDLTAADITITGGKTVDVTVNSTITATKNNAEGDIANGKIIVDGDTNTTAVSVKQTSDITKAIATEAVAEVKATETVTFTALKEGDSVTVNGLTFTAAKALDATQVAQAFSNLTKADTQSEAGVVGNGIYTGANGTGGTAIWTSGAANGATVVFTDIDASATNPTDLVMSGTVKTPTASYTNATIKPATVVVDGTAEVTEVLTANTITLGTVEIEDKSTATNTIKTVTVDGYGATSKIDATTVLSTLNLSNAQGTSAMVVADTADTLALTVEKLGSVAVYQSKGVAAVAEVKAVLTLTAAPLTLNVTSKGDNVINLTAAATTTLNVSGTGFLDVSTTDLAALKTVKVSGEAGLSLLAASGNLIESIDTTGTTGTVISTIDGTKATYTGGAGNDMLTVSNAGTAITKAIDLGNGNNTLTLTGAPAVKPTATIKAGTGTDTLSMSAASAAALTVDNTFNAKIEGFERLTVAAASANEVVNLANMDDINYVTTTGASVGTAQITTFTIDNTTSSLGDVFTITVNGKEYSYTTLAGNETAVVVSDGLKAAIGDDLGSAITLNAAGASTIVLTSAAKGNAFTASVSQVTVPLAATSTTANVTGLTLQNMLTDGTVVLTANGNIKVDVKDAADNATDVLNVIAQSNILGTVSTELIVNNVETININTVESYTTTGVASAHLQTIDLTAYQATKVNVTGNDDLTLQTKGATKLVTVDASTLEGDLTYATSGTEAVTVKGGLGDDTIVSTSAKSVITGGAGADTLALVNDTSNLVSLSGGEGKDTYVIGTTSNQNAYATITGTAAELSGDVIVFANMASAVSAHTNTITDFNVAKIDLGTTAVFDSLVNEAAKSTSADAEVAYFVFEENTYLVQNNSVNATFEAGVDSIVKISGIVDFTFNETTNVLEIA